MLQYYLGSSNCERQMYYIALTLKIASKLNYFCNFQTTNGPHQYAYIDQTATIFLTE